MRPEPQRKPALVPVLLATVLTLAAAPGPREWERDTGG